MRRIAILTVAVVVLLGSVVLAGCNKPGANATTPANSSSATTSAAGGGATTPATDTSARPKKVALVAPCGMLIPLMAVKTAFEAKYPDTQVTMATGNSIIKIKEILQKNEPWDIIITPGTHQLAMLQGKGLVDESTVTPFCDLELIAMVPKGNPAGINKPRDFLKAKTISMPDPNLDSSGYAAREALTKLGIWDQLKARTVTVEDAINSHTYVASGKSDVGIAFLHCPVDTNPEKLAKSKVAIGFMWPTDLFTPVHGIIAMSKNAADPEASKAFIAFVTSPEAQKLLGENQLTPIGKAPKVPAA